MTLKELQDFEILDFLMNSEYEDNYSPDEFKYLLNKWKYFYRLSNGKYNRLKDDSEYEIKNLKENCMRKTEDFFVRNLVTQDNAPSLEYLAMNNKGPQTRTTLQLHEALSEPSVNYDAANKIVHVFLNTNIFDKYSHSPDIIVGYLHKIPIQINQYPDRKHIFISGHVPITSKFYKEKGGKVLHYTSLSHDMNIMNIFLDILSSLNPTPIYLCADTHNFQIMSIQHNNKFIPQIVAGTGGADPDDLKPYMQNMKIAFKQPLNNLHYGLEYLEIYDNSEHKLNNLPISLKYLVIEIFKFKNTKNIKKI